MEKPTDDDNYIVELRLLLEELCCDLCRYEHGNQEGMAPEQIAIVREFSLGAPDAFADIRVAAPGQPPYFVEVKFGYKAEVLLRHLRRKYGEATPAIGNASKVVLVIDREQRADWPQLEAALPACLRPGLKLEVWDEQIVLALLRKHFGVNINKIDEESLLDVRQSIDRAKGFYAFGDAGLAAYDTDVLRLSLLWHFGFWRLRQLREKHQLTPRTMFPPGAYHGVAVLLADLCSFSSYVRDTRDDQVVRQCLTSFYSKARYEIINRGGMLYQFVGDEVIGLFGIPDRDPDYLSNALKAARSLVDIGNAISHHWQRQIDRVLCVGERQ